MILVRKVGETTTPLGATMNGILIVCAVLCVAAIEPTMAESAAAGPGARTCGEFAKDYGENPLSEFNYFSWAQGWLSGLNSAEGAKTGRKRVLVDLLSTPVETQMLIIRQYCNAHPLAQYTQAVAYLRNSSLRNVSYPALPAASTK
jgi:hypothetical protein